MANENSQPDPESRPDPESTRADDVAPADIQGPEDPAQQEDAAHEQDSPPTDETIHINNEGSAGELTVVDLDGGTDGDLPESDLPEGGDLHDDDDSQDDGDLHSGDTTLVPSTEVSFIQRDTPQDDPDQTVSNLDSTLRMDDEPNESEASSAKPRIYKTVKASDVDKTVVMRGGTDANKTVSDRQGESTVRVDVDPSAKTAADVEPPSIMASEEIGATVNPRELSEKDATIWNSAVGSASDEPSVLPPAIDRTFSDKAFDRLRKCDVAQLKAETEKSTDYKLVRKLGQGGMGDVFVARQGSLDRLLALKVIKPLAGKKRAQLLKNGKLESVEDERRQQFLSEAIVTGDLEHPNIVPIHDVALTSSGELFYAMKRVIGTPWSDEIKDNSRDKNIEILLKVADAVGFAHTRGVVHRDIKPENIMLGDFGVVMVMDWGLALPTSEYEKQNSIFATSGLGGTPAFMAPEMATGPLDQIGPASDIYLLGATLFMIITGYAPHQAKNVTECLIAVRGNKIRSVPDEKKGELLDIALKAMATRPEDRYPDVESFQEAIRLYRSHAESIALTSRAQEILETAKEERSYQKFSKAAFGFEEAVELWPGNKKAKAGIAEATLLHAEAAYDNGDYDLGLSLLNENNAEHQPLIQKLTQGREARESREKWLKRMKVTAAALLGVILIGGGGALFLINRARGEAERQQQFAEQQRERAEEQKLIAEEKKLEVEIEKREVERQRDVIAAQNEEVEAKRLLAEQKTKEAEQERAIAVAEKDKADKARKAAELAEAETREALKREEQAKLLEVAAKEKAEAETKRAEEAEAVAKQEATKAREAEAEAVIARNKETAERKRAEESEKRAISSEKLALESEERALESEAAAIASGRRATYEAYVSKVALAKARLERRETDGARQILGEVADNDQTWEWRWLSKQTDQSLLLKETGDAVVDFSLAAAGNIGALALKNGRADLIPLTDEGEKIVQRASVAERIPEGENVTAVAVSPKETVLAIGDASGDVLLVPLTSTRPAQRLSGHEGPINDLQFTADGLLVSASQDKSVRVWDPSAATEWTAKKACWHISPVKQVAVAGTAGSLMVAAAVSDDTTGRVVVWSLRGRGDSLEIEPKGKFEQHEYPVTSLAISDDMRRIASGDAGGNVLVWNPSELRVVDLTKRIANALDAISEDKPKSEPLETETRIATIDLADNSSEDEVRGANQTGAHSDVVHSIHFSADGSSLLTSSADRTLKLWDVADTQTLLKTLGGHGQTVIAAEFLRGDDSIIVSASMDRTVRRWDPAEYVPASVANAHDDASIWSASLYSGGDKTMVVTASDDHTARVLEIDSKTLASTEVTNFQDKVLEEGTTRVAMSMRLDKVHRRLYIGSADAMIRIWDLDLGTQVGEASGTGLNNSFAISDNGGLMLTGSSDSGPDDVRAILWKLDPLGKSPPRDLGLNLKGHKESVVAFAIAPGSKLLFTGDRKGYGIIWDAETGEQVGEQVEAVRGERINAATFSVDGRHLLIGSDNQQLAMINVETREVERRMRHLGYVTQISLSPNGRFALTVSDEPDSRQIRSTATLWDLSNFQQQVLHRIETPRVRGEDRRPSYARIKSAQFDETGEIAVVSRSRDARNPASVLVFDVSEVVEQGLPVNEQVRSTNGQYPSKAFLLPRSLENAEFVLPIDRQQLLTMNKNAAFLWDIENPGNKLKSYRTHAELTEASFSFDGKYVATGSRSVKIWDARTGEALGKLELTHPVRSVQFAPVPSQLGGSNASPYVFATGGDEGIARVWLWDPQTPDEIPSVRVDDNEGPIIRRVRFSPKGDRVMVVGDRGLARVWDLEQPQQSIRLEVGDDIDLRCAAFSQDEDGSFVAAGSGGKDQMIRVWQLADASAGEKIGPPSLLIGHAGAINDVAILGDGADNLRVMSASSDKTARVWDPRLGVLDENGEQELGREIISLRRHTGDVTAIDITQDGELMMTADKTGTVRLWPAAPAPPKSNLFDSIGAAKTAQ